MISGIIVEKMPVAHQERVDIRTLEKLSKIRRVLLHDKVLMVGLHVGAIQMDIKAGASVSPGNHIRIKLAFKRPGAVDGARVVGRIEKLAEMLAAAGLGPDELAVIECVDGPYLVGET